MSRRGKKRRGQEERRGGGERERSKKKKKYYAKAVLGKLSKLRNQYIRMTTWLHSIATGTLFDRLTLGMNCYFTYCLGSLAQTLEYDNHS